MVETNVKPCVKLPWSDRIRLKIIARRLPPAARILDVGCGSGGLIPCLPEGCSYIGIDNNTGLIKQDRDAYPDQFFREIDAASSVFPFNKDAFDAVVLSDLLEYIPNPRILLSEVGRVLKLSGHVVVGRPSRLGRLSRRVCSPLSSTKNRKDHDLAALLPGTGLQVVGNESVFFGLYQLYILKKEN